MDAKEEFLREKIAAIYYDEEYATTPEEILEEAYDLFPDQEAEVSELYTQISEELNS